MAGPFVMNSRQEVLDAFEDVAREYGVSRQTMYDTFGERGMPDATEKGRRR